MPRPVPSCGPGGRAAATDLPKILDAAMALIRSRGLEDLTMRRLAEELGVWTGTLYHHVGADKERLVKLVVDAIAGTIELPSLDIPWDERLRRLLRSVHTALCRHPGVAGYLLDQGIAGPHGIRLSEALVGAICDSGLDTAEAARVDMLLLTILFADAQRNEVPTSSEKAAELSARIRTRSDRFIGELEHIPEGAPLALALDRQIELWQPGEYLEWVIDLALARIRAVASIPS